MDKKKLSCVLFSSTEEKKYWNERESESEGGEREEKRKE